MSSKVSVIGKDGEDGAATSADFALGVVGENVVDMVVYRGLFKKWIDNKHLLLTRKIQEKLFVVAMVRGERFCKLESAQLGLACSDSRDVLIH